MPRLTTAPPLTIADYRLLPETGPRYQLVEGDLHMAPAPNRYHQDISRNLELVIGQYLKKSKLGKLYDAPFDVYLEETNVFQPDIVFVSNERAHILTDAGAEGAPDLIVEILSPRTRKIDTDVKFKVYARCGVRELWIIDPGPRKIAIYDLASDAGRPVATWGEADSFERPVFPGLRFDGAEIFEE
jgi:Uma2 family endonuclease